MRLIFNIYFFISICHVLFSSTEMCGNGTMSLVQSQIYSDILTNMTSRNSESNGADTISRKIPVTFVMATTAEIDLDELLKDADSAYAKMNFNFESYDTLFVNNTQYYHLDTTAAGIEEGMAFRKEYHRFNSLNVYIVDTLVGLQGHAPYCGVNDNYYGFSNWVILSNYNGGTDTDRENDNFSFIHELGHHFCLLHTHYGSVENIDGCLFEGENAEYVDEFECDTRGDLLCDTPADPGLSQQGLVNSVCEYDNTKCKNRDLEDYDEQECLQSAGDVNGDGQENIHDIILLIKESEYTNIIDYCSDVCNCEDPHGDPYFPDTGNYMSFTREICGNHFSSMQDSVITRQYDNHELNRYLDCSGEYMGNDWSCAGCMEQTACNYEPEALIENYSCEFQVEGYCDGIELSIEGSLSPDNYSLSIYPNPFNPIITISYSISQFMSANIRVYDITGRILETLINTNLIPGKYSVNWDASNYPSGVYIIRMNSGEFTKTQKAVLVK